MLLEVIFKEYSRKKLATLATKAVWEALKLSKRTRLLVVTPK
jgi:hypothetical protein